MFRKTCSDELFWGGLWEWISSSNQCGERERETLAAHMAWVQCQSLPEVRAPLSCASSETQQRYFSYHAILVAIVWQNFFVLVFMGYRTLIARYVAKWGIAQMCLCETKYQEGASHHLGGMLTSLKKYRAIWGIAAIVSQYRAIWGH